MKSMSKVWIRHSGNGLVVLSLAVFGAIAACAGCRYADEAEQKKRTVVSISQGAVNGVCFERNDHRLVVYGDPLGQWQAADMVLFTHSRRDVVWAGRSLVQSGAQSVVPAGEAEQFTGVEKFWTELWDKRFHDYGQQSTKVLTSPLRVDRTVREGDVIQWQDLDVQVLDTPGYTRSAISYVVEVDKRKYAFVGDLICGDGQVADLYSLQDAVAEAKIGGYHGYAGRMGQLIESLRKVAAANPDILVPARGPVIKRPGIAIPRLIDRLQAAYSNYLAVNAGRWYFKERYDVLASRVLGDPAKVEWMPWARTIEKAPPNWVVPIDNSRLLVSRDRSGFLIDCGSRGVFERVQKLREAEQLTSVDGFFITHYHDDHTDNVNALLDACGCSAYVTPCMEDVLRHPDAHRLPCLTTKPITRLKVVPDGYRMRWKEFTLTFHDFPGQTIYHDALLVEKDGGEKVFFVGDSFTPSGMDDYCLQNRNVLRKGTGYLYCLDVLKNKVPAEALLINEHVVEPFQFGSDQLDLMANVLQQRNTTLKYLFPWDDVNYGLDEQWARLYPYGREATPGRPVNVAVKLLNHSANPVAFSVSLNVPEGFAAEPKTQTVTAGPGQEVEAKFQVNVPDSPASSVHVITADVKFGPWDLRQWCEGLIKIAASN